MTKNSNAYRLYATMTINERHRHRYEVNVKYLKDLERAGLHFVGKDTTGTRMEIIEIKDHPFFFAAQYHPEYKSIPSRPSPPFRGLLTAAVALRDKTNQDNIIKSSSVRRNTKNSN